uniref:BRCA1-associated RING domain protein 1-like n=1 Tax=Diabrotica virgifera virgifera TaxID=50390 RepID=A0A6P7GZG2_DIAVI
MEVNELFEKLKQVQTFLQCQECNDQNKQLVRLKICGHYICKACFKESKQACPVCKTVFNDNNIEWDNIYSATKDILENLNDCISHLLNKDSPNEQKKSSSTSTRPDKLTYKNKTYHVNFIDKQKVNNKGESALHVSCRRKKIEVVFTLLQKKVDVNAQDFAGWVPLHEAIESGSLEIVEMLLKHGALTNVPGQDYTTPLHKAVSCRNKSIIRLLLQYGADRNALDYFGKKPLECIDDPNEFKSIFLEQVDLIRQEPQLFCLKQMVAFCYYTDTIYKNKLKQNKIKIEEKYDCKKVTHFIIKKTHKISVKILTAMLEGCTIIPQEYIDDYVDNNYFIPITDYKFVDLPLLNIGIQKSIMNDMLKLPKLFDGISFYITGHVDMVNMNGCNVQKDNLATIIKAGGGQILQRAPTPSTCEKKVYFPFHAAKSNAKCCNYIVYEESNPPVLMYHMPELKHKSSKWLIDCVVNFAILD